MGLMIIGKKDGSSVDAYDFKHKVKAAKRLKIRTHRKLQWESSDTSVARVTASGKVKAKKAGTCYVYVYAQDGVFARCKVTVN